MAGFVLAVAIFCTFAVVLALLTSDVPKQSWMIGPDKEKHPGGYWALIGGHAFVAAIAWLRVAEII